MYVRSPICLALATWLLLGCVGQAKVVEPVAEDTMGDADGTEEDPSDETPAAPLVSPFGIASSYSSSTQLGQWLPAIAGTGVKRLRGIDMAHMGERLDTVDTNDMEAAAILMWTNEAELSIPIGDLQGWSEYVTNTVTEGLGRIHQWEVWNEPPNFTRDTSPTDYAAVFIVAAQAVKAVDPTAEVGIAVKSTDLNWLDQAIRAGAAGHFDYITVHPYEQLGAIDSGYEPAYLAIVPTIRKMLRARDPEHENVPIDMTEIGSTVGGDITADIHAQMVVKAYVLGIAQGIRHVYWFEGRDGDSGPMGLLEANDVKRPGYTALQTLITHLSELPRYVGWVIVKDRNYGFVFHNGERYVMVVWAPKAGQDTVALPGGTQVVTPATGAAQSTSTLLLSRSPLIVLDPPEEFVAAAQSHGRSPVPWGGDFTRVSSVYLEGSNEQGVHLMGNCQKVIVDGIEACDMSTRTGSGFRVDPGFLSFETRLITITAEVRAHPSVTQAGFNLQYESTTGLRGGPGWFTVPGSDRWYTKTWLVADDQFVGNWAYNISLNSDSLDHSRYYLRSLRVTKE